MVRAIFQHRVKDFKAWKKVFDANQKLNSQFGVKIESVNTTREDPNNVYIIGEFPNAETINTFSTHPDLVKAMQESGVIGQPTITVLNEVSRG